MSNYLRLGGPKRRSYNDSFQAWQDAMDVLSGKKDMRHVGAPESAATAYAREQGPEDDEEAKIDLG